VSHIEIDLDGYRLLRDGQPIHLTRMEWALLAELARHPGQVLTHRVLLQRVWGAVYGDESDYLHTYIRRLRRKIEDEPANPRYLLTEPGLGYRFEPPTPITEAPNPAASPTRTINALPQNVSARYVGRAAERATLHKLLTERARLISVYGRAGVGKTALVCKVLSDVAREAASFNGMVFLSGANVAINLSRLFADFKKLLPDDEELETAWRETANPTHKAALLLDALHGGQYLLLLDALDALQSEAGSITDAGIAALLNTVLEQGGALSILVTSERPLELPRPLKVWERVIALNRGLPVDEAVELLRLCDPDGAAQLRDTSRDVLRPLAERVGGFPRALEAVAGLLLDDPLLTPAALLNDSALFKDAVELPIAAAAIDRLDAEVRRVLSGVAIFGRAVKQDAVEYVLDDANVRPLLSRLVRAYFVLYDTNAETFDMHSFDRAYCLAQLPAGQGGDYGGFTQLSLHHRAANYYQEQRVSQSRLTSLANADPLRQEFKHRAAAHEFEAAYRLALMLHDILIESGSYEALIEMYETVGNHLNSPEDQAECLLRIGRAQLASGSPQAGLASLEQARMLASWKLSGAILEGLGWAHYDLGHLRQAADHLHQSEAIFRRAGDQMAQASALGGLGWVSYLRGEFDDAARYFEAALAIYRSVNDTRGLANNLGDLGEVYRAVGRTGEAIQHLREALTLAEQVGAQRQMSYKGGYLATAYLLANDLAKALKTVTDARELDMIDNAFTLASLHGVILLCNGEQTKAQEAFSDAVRTSTAAIAHTPGLYRAHYARALAKAGLAALNLGDTADADFAAAKAVCSDVGVVQLYDALLEKLLACS
jgi:DNA-binding winged helix-turn-helix (wHTH) protein/tetratricopeptide (TPR) repeat protein